MALNIIKAVLTNNILANFEGLIGSGYRVTILGKAITVEPRPTHVNNDTSAGAHYLYFVFDKEPIADQNTEERNRYMEDLGGYSTEDINSTIDNGNLWMKITRDIGASSNCYVYIGESTRTIQMGSCEIKNMLTRVPTKDYIKAKGTGTAESKNLLLAHPNGVMFVQYYVRTAEGVEYNGEAELDNWGPDSPHAFDPDLIIFEPIDDNSIDSISAVLSKPAHETESFGDPLQS